MCGCYVDCTRDDGPPRGTNRSINLPQELTQYPLPAGNVAPIAAFPYSKDFSFCLVCGMSLRTTQCPACGQKVNIGWRACAYCGSPLGENPGTTGASLNRVMERPSR